MKVFVALVALCMVIQAGVAVKAQSTRPTDVPVVLVADFTNLTKDKHALILQAAADGVAAELKKRGVYEVISRSQVEKTAANRGMRPPYSAEDYVQVAKDLGAELIVSGEIREVYGSIKGVEREVEVGIVVRVKDTESGDMVNGAATRGSVTAPGGSKSEGELGIDAAALAATRAVTQIESYKAITGTIMNSVGNGPLMLNRGATHGVKSKQEFIVLRAGKHIGRVQARKPSSSYTELNVLENNAGIQPQDRVIALFPEPKLTK